MQTRETLLDELRNLAAGTGPDITLFKFHEATGIHPCHIYRKWGNWTTLRLAAGLPPRSRISKVYSDDHLFQELNRTGAACSEFPTISAFGRFSQRCWATLSNRFGRRSEVWRRYFSWLQQHDPAQRPAYAQDLPLDVDPATVPGVTSHRSADARQQAIDDYNEQRLYLDESLLGPPPPGWKPGPPKLNEANWNFDIPDLPPRRRRSRPRTESAPDERRAPESKESTPCATSDSPSTIPGATGGLQATSALPTAAERDIQDKPASESAATGPAGGEQLTPEEWNAFYNHPKAFPIVDINAGLFPRSPFDGRDPADPRPNPPPWERNFEPPPDPDSESSPPHATDVPPASTLPAIAAESDIHAQPISESAQAAPGGRGRKPVTLDEWDLYFKGLWALMIATTVTLAGLAESLTPHLSDRRGGGRRQPWQFDLSQISVNPDQNHPMPRLRNAVLFGLDDEVARLELVGLERSGIHSVVGRGPHAGLFTALTLGGRLRALTLPARETGVNAEKPSPSPPGPANRSITGILNPSSMPSRQSGGVSSHAARRTVSGPPPTRNATPAPPPAPGDHSPIAAECGIHDRPSSQSAETAHRRTFLRRPRQGSKRVARG